MVAIGLGAAAVGFLIRHLFRTAGGVTGVEASDDRPEPATVRSE
jgi:hypothetical protein